MKKQNLFRLLAIVLLAAVVSCTEKKKPGPTPDPAPTVPGNTRSELLTVAALNPAEDGKSLTVSFYERAAAYTISSDAKDFAGTRRLLEASLKDEMPVKMVEDAKRNLLTVTSPAKEEVESYRALLGTRVKDLEVARPFDFLRNDSITMNLADALKWRPLNLCITAIPDYATAKKVFDTCARQCCCKPGPYMVDFCIPFQYVPDGCYARAHKMRWIIETKFKYCSQKVFSYGVNKTATLAVNASKWGGCCIRWWYHVAPLVKVKTPLGVLAYVIDPSMFDGPVLLSTWLGAQENATACNPAGKLGSYQVTASSIYNPFGATDPNYQMTNQKLQEYKDLVSCD